MEEARRLRKQLHETPELAFSEHRTKAILIKISYNPDKFTGCRLWKMVLCHKKRNGFPGIHCFSCRLRCSHG